MPLPEEMMKKLEGAKYCSFLGIELKDLTKDELIVCAMIGWAAAEDARKREYADLYRCRPFYLQ